MYLFFRGLTVTEILISLLCIFLASTFHEYGHALVAYKRGDDTAKMMGRLTLDPIKHIDILGLLSMLLFGFGWAKPVPVNLRRCKNMRLSDFLISIAGPGANLCLIAFSVLLLWLGSSVFGITATLYYTIVLTFFQYNVLFMLFNLLPVPPLDGYHVLRAALWNKIPAGTLEKIERYGSYLMLLMVLVLYWTGLLTTVLTWALSLVMPLVFPALL